MGRNKEKSIYNHLNDATEGVIKGNQFNIVFSVILFLSLIVMLVCFSKVLNHYQNRFYISKGEEMIASSDKKVLGLYLAKNFTFDLMEFDKNNVEEKFVSLWNLSFQNSRDKLLAIAAKDYFKEARTKGIHRIFISSDDVDSKSEGDDLIFIIKGTQSNISYETTTLSEVTMTIRVSPVSREDIVYSYGVKDFNFKIEKND